MLWNKLASPFGRRPPSRPASPPHTPMRAGPCNPATLGLPAALAAAEASSTVRLSPTVSAKEHACKQHTLTRPPLPTIPVAMLNSPKPQRRPSVYSERSSSHRDAVQHEVDDVAPSMLLAKGEPEIVPSVTQTAQQHSPTLVPPPPSQANSSTRSLQAFSHGERTYDGN